MKRQQLLQQVANLAFYSRDCVTFSLPGHNGDEIRKRIRALEPPDFYQDDTTSLIWLQVEELLTWYDLRGNSILDKLIEVCCIEQQGRKRGQDRKLVNAAYPHALDTIHVLVKHGTQTNMNLQDLPVTNPTTHQGSPDVAISIGLVVEQIGQGPWQKAGRRDKVIILLGKGNDDAKYPHNLQIIRRVPLLPEGKKLDPDWIRWQSTIVKYQPRAWTKKAKRLQKEPQPWHLSLSYEHSGLTFGWFRLLSSDPTLDRTGACPPLPKVGPKGTQTQGCTAICLNQGSGLCWSGTRNSSIYLLNTIQYLQGVEGEDRKWIDVHSKTISSGAVTNLLAVGEREVVAIFSDGVMALFALTATGHPELIREYNGHVNHEHNPLTVACIDSGSRLLAVRGTDALIRIWHLDDSYPLGTPWHQDRSRAEGEKEPGLPSRPQDRTWKRFVYADEAGMSTVPQMINSGDVDEAFTEWDRLLFEPLPSRSKQGNSITTSLSTLRTRFTVHMTWGSRRLDEGGSILPPLILAGNSKDGPRLLYFEPASLP